MFWRSPQTSEYMTTTINEILNGLFDYRCTQTRRMPFYETKVITEKFTISLYIDYYSLVF